MDEAELLLPTLIASGYAARDDEANTWWFTKKGVARHKEIVIEGPSLAPGERIAAWASVPEWPLSDG